jgi:hypothetical protein
VLMCFADSASIVHATNITYDLFSPTNGFQAAGPFVITGTITTDGRIGTITAADVVAWSWTLTTSTDTYAADSHMAGSSVGLHGLPAIATESSIYLSYPPFGTSTALNMFGLLSAQYNLVYDTASIPAQGSDPCFVDCAVQVQIHNGDGTLRGGPLAIPYESWGTPVPQTPFVLATATPVPEPSIIALVYMSVLSILFAWGIRRK